MGCPCRAELGHTPTGCTRRAGREGAALLQPPPTSPESSSPKMVKVRLPPSEAGDLAPASQRGVRDLGGDPAYPYPSLGTPAYPQACPFLSHSPSPATFSLSRHLQTWGGRGRGCLPRALKGGARDACQSPCSCCKGSCHRAWSPAVHPFSSRLLGSKHPSHRYRDLGRAHAFQQVARGNDGVR